MIDMIFSSLNFDFFTRALLCGKLYSPMVLSVRGLHLDYKSASDRLAIGVLKSLGFLADDGRPTQRYFDYLDQTQSQAVLAQAIRESYADLFQVNKNANQMSKSEVINKFKTLSQGQYSESVLDKMGMTFTALCTLADFGAAIQAPKPPVILDDLPPESLTPASEPTPPSGKGLAIAGLVYNIQLILPESRDPKVYDALFDSLRRHLS
jgi:hypothetical protein